MMASNGLHVPSDTVLDLISKYRVNIRISNYSELKNATEPLKRALSERSIAFSEYHFAGGSDSWSYMGGKEVIKEENNDVVEKRFRECSFRGCTTLEDGKIAHCSRAINASRVQSFRVKNDDVVKVRGNTNLLEDISRYLSEKNYMEACRYCYGTNSGKTCSPAEQI